MTWLILEIWMISSNTFNNDRVFSGRSLGKHHEEWENVNIWSLHRARFSKQATMQEEIMWNFNFLASPTLANELYRAESISNQHKTLVSFIIYAMQHIPWNFPQLVGVVRISRMSIFLDVFEVGEDDMSDIFMSFCLDVIDIFHRA